MSEIVMFFVMFCVLFAGALLVGLVVVLALLDLWRKVRR